MTAATDPTVARAPSAEGYGRKGDRATAAVRNLIASGALRPGEHLRQDELASRIGTTRVPIREAFKTLLAEGVLEHRPNYGHFVATLRSDELVQICWLRDVTENKLAATVRWTDPEGIGHLHRLNDAMLGLLGHSAYEIVEADRAFHQGLYELSPMRIVARETARMWGLMQPYRMFMDYGHAVVTRMHTEHEAILAALAAEHLDAYTRAISAHQRHIYGIVDDLATREAAGTATD